MVNTVRSYKNSYDYGSVIHKQKSSKMNKIYKIMGGILLLLSIFILYKLPDQDGNWTLAAWSLIVSVALFTQIRRA